MSKKRNTSLANQALILVVASMISRIIGFVYKLPIMNWIDDAGTGLLGQGATVYTFFFLLSSAGLPAAISRMVSARIATNQHGNAHKVFRVSLRFATLLGLASSLILFFGASFIATLIKSPDAYYSFIVLSPTVLITSILSTYKGYFQGMGNTVPSAFSDIIDQVFNAIVSLILTYIFYKQGDIVKAAAAGNAGTSVGALMALIFIIIVYNAARKKYIDRDIEINSEYARYEPAKDILKELVSTAFPIIAGTAVFSFTNIIDTSMIMSRIQAGGFTEVEALAFSGALTQKFNTLTTLPVVIASSFATAVIPSISASMAIKDRKSVNDKTNLAFRLAMLICIPAAFGLGIFADQIYTFLFRNVSDGAYMLKQGFFIVVLLSAYQISTGILQGIGQVKIPALAALVGCIVKIPVNYFLLAIPEINIMGAIGSTMICYLIAVPINLYFVYKETRVKLDYLGIFIKPIFSSIIMSMVCYIFYYLIFSLTKSNAISLIVSIGIGVLAYGFAMLLSGGLSENELKSIPMGDKVLSVFNWMIGK